MRAVPLSEFLSRPIPEARVSDDGKLLCDTCGKRADTIHFIPWVTRVERIEAACPAHDPDGYWVEISRLDLDMLQHLSGKVGYLDEDGIPSHAVQDLLFWLGHKGGLGIVGGSRTKP